MNHYWFHMEPYGFLWNMEPYVVPAYPGVCSISNYYRVSKSSTFSIFTDISLLSKKFNHVAFLVWVARETNVATETRGGWPAFFSKAVIVQYL